MSASLSKLARKDGAYLVRTGPFTTLGNIELSAQADQKRKKVGRAYHETCKIAKRGFQQVGQDDSFVLTTLLRNHLASLESEINRYRKVQIVTSAYVYSLCTSFLASFWEEDSICVVNTGLQYSIKSVATFLYGSAHGRLDFVMILAERSVEGASNQFKLLKSSVWFRRILIILQIFKNF